MTAKGLWKWFRKHEKMILAAIVVLIVPAFGLGSILVTSVAQSAESDTAFEIDGDEIDFHEVAKLKRRFFSLVTSYITFTRSRSQNSPAQRVDNVDIMKHVRLLREAREAGIQVTEAEIDDMITKYAEASMRFPCLLSSQQFLTDHEALIYSHTPSFHIMFRINPGREGFERKLYLQYLNRMGITEEEFRTTVREILLILKLKYFMWSTTIVSTEKAFAKYGNENISKRCAYVRFDASDFKVDGEEVDRKELEEYYQKNSTKFLEPHRRKIEYFQVASEDIERRASPTLKDTRAYYEREKDVMFREAVKKETPPKKDENKEGKQEGTGEKKEGNKDEGAEKKDQGPKGDEGDPGQGGEVDEAAKEGAEEKVEKEEVKYVPFEKAKDKIEKLLKEQMAQEYLSTLMGRLVDTVRRLEAGVRENREDFPDPNEGLRTQIDFDKISRNVAATREWTKPYTGFRVGVVREERFLSKEEMVEALGKIGKKISEESFHPGILTIGNVIPVTGGFVAVRVVAEKLPYVEKIENIEAKVTEEFLLDRALERAFEKAGKVRGKMMTSSFDEVARIDNLKVLETGFFRISDKEVPGTGDFPPVGEAPFFVGAAFSVETEQIRRPVREESLKAVFLIREIEKKLPSPAEMKKQQREDLIDKERKTAWEEVNRPWGDEFRKHHEIKDKTRDRK
ncbi:MAG: SurA N-terminal domain-containing protein [Planctomycetota bacterium]|jgi:hypothetical protein